MNDPALTEKRTKARHDCRLVSEYHGAVRVVRVLGCLDWTTACEFRDLMREECTEAMVVVDLGGTTHMDSVGTGHLLTATARTKRQGQQLVMVVADPLMLEVLTTTGLDTVVPVVATVSEALFWLDAQGSPSAVGAP
ncbi:MAG: STAS domain-containing protein [Actinomycetota bacterium]|nr:STAS domain-containing protein [Actinomycetota bacterium]